MSRIALVAVLLLVGCTESPREPYEPYDDFPPGVTVTYYDFSDGIAPDTVYFLAIVGDWNGVDTLFCSLSDSARIIAEGWWVDYGVELPMAYDPLEDLELHWRAWMAGDTAELIWTP